MSEIFEFILLSEKMGQAPVVIVKGGFEDDFDEVLVVRNGNCLGCVNLCFIKNGQFTENQYFFEKKDGVWLSDYLDVDSEARDFILYQFEPDFHMKELSDDIKSRMGISQDGSGFMLYK